MSPKQAHQDQQPVEARSKLRTQDSPAFQDGVEIRQQEISVWRHQRRPPPSSIVVSSFVSSFDRQRRAAVRSTVGTLVVCTVRQESHARPTKPGVAMGARHVVTSAQFVDGDRTGRTGPRVGFQPPGGFVVLKVRGFGRQDEFLVATRTSHANGSKQFLFRPRRQPVLHRKCHFHKDNEQKYHAKQIQPGRWRLVPINNLDQDEIQHHKQTFAPPCCNPGCRLSSLVVSWCQTFGRHESTTESATSNGIIIAIVVAIFMAITTVVTAPGTRSKRRDRPQELVARFQVPFPNQFCSVFRRHQCRNGVLFSQSLEADRTLQWSRLLTIADLAGSVLSEAIPANPMPAPGNVPVRQRMIVWIWIWFAETNGARRSRNRTFRPKAIVEGALHSPEDVQILKVFRSVGSTRPCLPGFSPRRCGKHSFRWILLLGSVLFVAAADHQYCC
mmetsp:Transcript_32862/g.77576  ORF Transcript_32862/g.77576 Transcript_32862/m.77576 type:complete len:443 (-) Transcript_32862:74-1402(-)